MRLLTSLLQTKLKSILARCYRAPGADPTAGILRPLALSKNAWIAMRRVLLSLVLLCGCTSSPETPYSSDASKMAVVERYDPIKSAIRDLEGDLLLQLWLHLQRQESRLNSRLRKNPNTQEAEAISVLLPILQQQTKEVWEQMFSNE